MTPKPIQWLGAALVLGILAIILVSAIQNMVAGEAKRPEIITVVVTAIIVVAAVLLKLTIRNR